MIITITGKPCSGKGSVAKCFCKRHNFEYICTGDMFRELSLKSNLSIADFQKTSQVASADKKIDSKIKKIGLSRLNENIVIDSRLAWHFIPKSFKVFIDVDLDIAANRLFNDKRESEKVCDIESAKQALVERWNIENERYQKLYSVTNTDTSKYDLVISSNNLTPEEIATKIYLAYKKFIKNAKSS